MQRLNLIGRAENGDYLKIANVTGVVSFEDLVEVATEDDQEATAALDAGHVDMFLPPTKTVLFEEDNEWIKNTAAKTVFTILINNAFINQPLINLCVMTCLSSFLSTIFNQEFKF